MKYEYFSSVLQFS